MARAKSNVVELRESDVIREVEPKKPRLRLNLAVCCLVVVSLFAGVGVLTMLERVGLIYPTPMIMTEDAFDVVANDINTAKNQARFESMQRTKSLKK